jgi:hypothetical protein
MVSYHRSSTTQLLLLLLFPFSTTKHTSNPATSVLRSTRHTLTRILRTSRNTARATLYSIRRTLPIPTQRTLCLDRITLVVLAAPLSPVNTFFGKGVADGLREASFADLAADEVVDAVLEVVDLGYACDFCFVEIFYTMVC